MATKSKSKKLEKEEKKPELEKSETADLIGEKSIENQPNESEVKTENIKEKEITKIEEKKDTENVENENGVKESDREGFYNFSEIEEYTSDYDHLIEKNRKKFEKVINKDRIIRTSVIIIALFLVVFSLIYIVNTLQNKPLGFSLIGVGALIMIFYLFITKGTTANLSNNYLNGFYTNSCLKFFEDKDKFQHLIVNPRSSKKKEDFEENGAFDNVSRIVSRNEVTFNYKGKEKVNITDLAAFSIGNDKQERPVFVGKYIVVPNKYTEEDSIYLYLKGYKFALPPTAIDTVAKVHNSENLMIQTDIKDYKKHIDDKIVGILDKYVCNNILLDATIVIKKGVTYFCLGYSDEFGAIPFKSKYNPGPYKQYLTDLDLFLDINSQIR